MTLIPYKSKSVSERGSDFACAVLEDDSLKCWGSNLFGQLGRGDTTTPVGDASSEMGDNLLVVDLGSGRTVKFIDSSGHHACALLNNNRVKCWGENAVGQLGRGDSTTPIGDGANEMGDYDPVTGDGLRHVDLGTNRTAQKITLGSDHSCALLDNDQLKCWGENAFGNLGQGHTNNLGDGSNEMGICF